VDHDAEAMQAKERVDGAYPLVEDAGLDQSTLEDFAGSLDSRVYPPGYLAGERAAWRS
jgi:hypothetical protein